jgi:hypothetical protein
MIDEDALLDYLASILVEAFLDRKVKTDPNFKDPRTTTRSLREKPPSLVNDNAEILDV